MTEPPDVNTAVRRIEALLDGLAETDPDSRQKAEELIQALMQLYGAGLGRVVEILRSANAAELIESMAADKLLASLLLLHGLHPEDAETRVRAALHRLERRLESHHLSLTGIVDGVARIVVERNGNGAPPPSLAEAIERAVAESAPDLFGIEIDGASPASAPLVQIELATGG
jgi:hypothetical protein